MPVGRFSSYLRNLTVSLAIALLSGNAIAESSLPTYSEVRAKLRSSDLVLLDRKGRVLQRTRKGFQSRQFEWTSLDAIPENTQKLIVLSEDQRFFEHTGVDWLALSATAVRNLWSKQPRGASTITMQLVGLLEGHRKRRGLREKWDQANEARELETRWKKSEILEAYLNLVSFRGEWVGVRAATEGLFGHDLYALNDSESAVLAALLRAPQAETKKIWERACELLVRSKAPTSICVNTLGEKEAFTLKRYPVTALKGESLARELAEGINLKGEQRTTLDADLQLFARKKLEEQLQNLKDQNVSGGGVLVLENATGNVLAYVSGSNDEALNYVDAVQAFRQAGSTLKPFIYLKALEDRRITASTKISDEPLDIEDGKDRLYRPSNFDHTFHGEVTVRVALASSLNIPAVRVLQKVGVSTFHSFARDLGFRNLLDADHYGPSMALGSIDVSLWDLTNAYRSISTNGMASNSEFLAAKPKDPPKRRFSPEGAFLIKSILSDRDARLLTFGWENPLATRYWTAVKTGTSKDMRDNWCVGFSDRYTVGVWIGNFAGAPMWNVTGISGAGPLWLELMNRLHEKQTSRAPVVAANLKKALIQKNGEWYLKGTEPYDALPEKSAPVAAMRAHIAYPPKGMLVAYDPDIPVANQKTPFEASEKDRRYLWKIDGHLLPSKDHRVNWAIGEKGSHRVELYAENGTFLDAVEYTVRGSPSE